MILMCEWNRRASPAIQEPPGFARSMESAHARYAAGGVPGSIGRVVHFACALGARHHPDTHVSAPYPRASSHAARVRLTRARLRSTTVASSAVHRRSHMRGRPHTRPPSRQPLSTTSSGEEVRTRLARATVVALRGEGIFPNMRIWSRVKPHTTTTPY